MKISPKKSLGQNFLINEGIIEKIVDAAQLQPSDTIIEIGPGTGNLTKHLTEKVQRLILIEKDQRLIESLRAEFGSAEVIEADILELNPADLDLRAGTYKLVANLPYYITSHFFKTIFEKWPHPKQMIVMVQKEVAQRIVAQPPDTNLLGLSVQLYAKPEIVSYVSAGSFRPIPDVDSAILKLTPHGHVLSPSQEELFFSLLRTAFAGKRKKLSNTLSKLVSDAVFTDTGVDPSARPQHLSLEQWLALTHALGNS